MQGRYSKHREHRSGRAAGIGSFQAPSAPIHWDEPQPSVPGESWSSRRDKTGFQARRLDMLHPETAGPTYTKDNQMAKVKCKNITNRNQGNMAQPPPSSLMTLSPGYPNTPEKQDLDLKS